MDAVERANARWYDRQEETKLGSGRGTQARVERQMVGYKEPAWRKKHLSEEEQQRRDWLRAQGMRDTSQDQKYMPDALRKQKTQELEAACAGKPWLRRNWPMVMDTRPGGDYVSFTGVISGGYDGAAVQVSSEESFLAYSTEWLKMGNIHPAELAEMHSFIATAQAIVDARTQKQESREISNKNLEMSNFKDIDSPVQVAAQAVQSAKTVRFDKGFVSDCASQSREPKYFTAFELAGSLSKAQLERIERLTDVLGVPVMTKRLPWLGSSEGNKMAMMNCFLSSQARYYGIVELINSGGNGSKSYMDEDDKKRSLGSNRLVGEFDKDSISRD